MRGGNVVEIKMSLKNTLKHGTLPVTLPSFPVSTLMSLLAWLVNL